MPVELIRREYETQKKIIATALRKQDELIAKMMNAPSEDYDWMSIPEAARRVGVSYCTIKRKIDNGQLHSKHIASKTFVRWSEVSAIDDKYGAEA